MTTADLWMDVSTLLRWEGKVTGIPRTVSQLVDELAKLPGLRRGFAPSTSGWGGMKKC